MKHSIPGYYDRQHGAANGTVWPELLNASAAHENKSGLCPTRNIFTYSALAFQGVRCGCKGGTHVCQPGLSLEAGKRQTALGRISEWRNFIALKVNESVIEGSSSSPNLFLQSKHCLVEG